MLPSVPAERHRYLLPFLDRRMETPTVGTFRFDRSGSPFDYRSNQAVRLGVRVSDPRGPYRLFSLSSSPTERGWIAVTCKITDSPYKSALGALRPGEPAEVIGPFGDFIYDPARPTVMIAGGIGITPFRGMIRFAVDTGAQSPIRLLYGARTPEEFAFRRELDELAEIHPDLSIRYSVSRPIDGVPRWEGPTGRIGEAAIREVAEALDRPNFLVAGLPEMVDATLHLLGEGMGIPEDRVNWEPFRGYGGAPRRLLGLGNPGTGADLAARTDRWA